MPNLHILMTNHTDLNCMNLLIQELPFLKTHYQTILVESVPYGLNNQEVLQCLAKTLLTHSIDFTKVQTQIGLSQEDCLAFQNIYSGPLSDEEKLLLKYTAAKKLEDKIQLPQGLTQCIHQYYYYHYLSEALKNGIELIGIESPSYNPGRGAFQNDRNEAIVANVMQVTKHRQNCLMPTGAEHGIDLMKAYNKTGTIKNSYTNLYCDKSVIDPGSNSQKFRREIETGRYILDNNQSYLYLELSQQNPEERSRILQERIIATKSENPVYHMFGRDFLEEKSSFCTDLSLRSGLSFFITVNKQYDADTVCFITGEDEKLAKRIQEKTGLGTFFKSNKGTDIFAIKNTNAPERTGILQMSLAKL